MHGFPCENASLPHCAYFTHIRWGGGIAPPQAVLQGFPSRGCKSQGQKGSFCCIKDPKGPKIEKFNLAWNFQSRLKTSISLEIFNLVLQQNSPQQNRVWWAALLKFQSRLKISIPEGDLEIFQSFSAEWPCKSAMWIFRPEFWGEFSDVNFGWWISWWWIFEGALLFGKHRPKKFDPRIRAQNSGRKNWHPRIRPTRCRIPSAETCPWMFWLSGKGSGEPPEIAPPSVPPPKHSMSKMLCTDYHCFEAAFEPGTRPRCQAGTLEPDQQGPPSCRCGLAAQRRHWPYAFAPLPDLTFEPKAVSRGKWGCTNWRHTSGPKKTTTARDVTEFCAFSPPGNRESFEIETSIFIARIDSRESRH